MELNKIADVYCNTQNDRVKIKKALETEGFVTAYQMETTLIVMEQIESPEEDN